MSRHSARSNAYRKAWHALRAQGLPCWLCRRPIDYTLRYPDPWSFSADHFTPRSRGGGETESLLPAHLVCNKRRGARPAAHTRPERQW